MKTILPRVLLTVLTFLLGVVPARALTIPASEDTTGYLNRITSFASNSSNLQVDSSRVAFLYFNLDDIPEGSVVKMARLRFYVPSIKAKGAGLGIHRVTGQWNEAIPGAQPGYETAPVAEIEASKLGSRRFMSVDVTSLVQDWINFTEANEGFAITALSTGSARVSPASVVISAKEGPALGLPAFYTCARVESPVEPSEIQSDDGQEKDQLHEQQSAGPQLAQKQKIEQNEKDKAADREQSAKYVDSPLHRFAMPEAVNQDDDESDQKRGDGDRRMNEEPMKAPGDLGGKRIGNLVESDTKVAHEDAGENVAGDHHAQRETRSEGRFWHRTHHRVPGAPGAIAKPRLLPRAGGWEMILHA